MFDQFIESLLNKSIFKTIQNVLNAQYTIKIV